ncbi:hypothetical protein C4B63_304g15 [Trypanosoma cruzi]|uniref:Uncharacterized protein n=1 Tax=Trypanosoma cruzi TaxID=5693 RepID=A0A2V2UHX6_TRYCR|nr:hypothetical protein C4B63_304g15 [Trypanosoma cruzi]
MPLSGEDQTLSARLLTLPATEHAILLNRFKFLDLVQRVAAADVAEMVQTIGLEALSYKGALGEDSTNICGCGGCNEASFCGKTHAPWQVVTPAQRCSCRKCSYRDPSPTTSFQTREEELKFINRMSQPQKERALPEFYLRKPPRDQQEERLMYARMDSSYSPLLGTMRQLPLHLLT